MRAILVLVFSGLTGCQVLQSGLGDASYSGPYQDDAIAPDGQAGIDVGEPPGIEGEPAEIGCSDRTREGFRDYLNWPDIAGCAGGFQQPGVIRSSGLLPTCNLRAGDTGERPLGEGCSAADLCAAGWHVCLNGQDVALHSSTRNCEGCVYAGEPRFFLIALGASEMGICSPDLEAANDLHGCGGSLGRPESDACSPLTNRMGFADCLGTKGVWSCGEDGTDSLHEALVVTKTAPNMGGVLCCKD